MILSDYDHDNWAAVGQDLGQLADWISSNTQCKSFTCRLVQGLLKEGDISLQSLQACEKELRQGEDDFLGGAASWANVDKQGALRSFANGFEDLAEGVKTC